MIASQSRIWAAAAAHFAQNADEPLLTLLGAAHSLANDPSSPEAHRLAESAARNAELLARMVRDLQRIAQRAAAPARREMIEVMPALRAALGSGNVRIEGDETLLALAGPADLAAFVEIVADAAEGKTVFVAAHGEEDIVRITIRTAFPDHPIDVALIRSLAEPLGPVSIGVDSTVAVTLPGLRHRPASGPRWQAKEAV